MINVCWRTCMPWLARSLTIVSHPFFLCPAASLRHMLLIAAAWLQMLVDAQKMEMEALELQVRLAVHGNRLARLDNPIMLDAFQKLKQTADHFMSFEE